VSGTSGGSTTGAQTTGPEKGCKEIDFLFVVDNSGSMADEQQNLVNSFPGFIDTIQNTLQAQDYHIMVIDTDASGGGNIIIQCSPDPPCCDTNCANNPTAVCNGTPCTPPQNGCDGELGAGKVNDQNDQSCNVQGGNRYMLDTQPNLNTTFECLALVGTTGNGNEQPMLAMTEALGPLNAQGECNEGFLRDNALLVVTYITDEEDGPNKSGGLRLPADWKQTLVNLKNGNEDWIVVLGIVGDNGVANPVCMGNDADDAPNLRAFADSFTNGMWSSVCSPDYSPFFDQAVSVIDTACDEIIPQ
jgi:hypothetical protein